jgi:uncharacterized membrane protein
MWQPGLITYALAMVFVIAGFLFFLAVAIPIYIIWILVMLVYDWGMNKSDEKRERESRPLPYRR